MVIQVIIFGKIIADAQYKIEKVDPNLYIIKGHVKGSRINENVVQVTRDDKQGFVIIKDNIYEIKNNTTNFEIDVIFEDNSNRRLNTMENISWKFRDNGNTCYVIPCNGLIHYISSNLDFDNNVKKFLKNNYNINNNSIKNNKQFIKCLNCENFIEVDKLIIGFITEKEFEKYENNQFVKYTCSKCNIGLFGFKNYKKNKKYFKIEMKWINGDYIFQDNNIKQNNIDYSNVIFDLNNFIYFRDYIPINSKYYWKKNLINVVKKLIKNKILINKQTNSKELKLKLEKLEILENSLLIKK